jgi:hypothetical protein
MRDQLLDVILWNSPYKHKIQDRIQAKAKEEHILLKYILMK